MGERYSASQDAPVLLRELNENSLWLVLKVNMWLWLINNRSDIGIQVKVKPLKTKLIGDVD